MVICHYNSQSIYSSMRSKNNCNQTQIIQFSVGQSGEYYIGLSQPDTNMFSFDPDYKYGYMSCNVFKQNGNAFDYVDGVSQNNRDPWKKM